jgi:hypothetical protein
LLRLLRDTTQERRLADARDAGHQEDVLHHISPLPHQAVR